MYLPIFYLILFKAINQIVNSQGYDSLLSVVIQLLQFFKLYPKQQNSRKPVFCPACGCFPTMNFWGSVTPEPLSIGHSWVSFKMSL